MRLLAWNSAAFRGFSYASRHNRDTDSSKLFEYARKPILSKPEPAWTRLAKKVKGAEVAKDSAESKHIGGIKKNIDLQDTIGKIEDELREEMAMSLGRTGLKMKFSMQQINEAKSLVDKVFSDTCSTEDDKIKSVKLFNEAREFACKTRIELIIHRQSIGLTWNNENIVEAEFPIPDPIYV